MPHRTPCFFSSHFFQSVKIRLDFYVTFVDTTMHILINDLKTKTSFSPVPTGKVYNHTFPIHQLFSAKRLSWCWQKVIKCKINVNALFKNHRAVQRVAFSKFIPTGHLTLKYVSISTIPVCLSTDRDSVSLWYFFCNSFRFGKTHRRSRTLTFRYTISCCHGYTSVRLLLMQMSLKHQRMSILI